MKTLSGEELQRLKAEISAMPLSLPRQSNWGSDDPGDGLTDTDDED